jgi:acetyl-CoA/propionyl-CoA carboxylase biotin carboxyl carrier protein
VRVDAGYEEGETLPGEFDSLLGKLVVYGESRPAALACARRALSEFRTGGVATVVPFHRAVVDHPDFCSEPFAVHTRWIEDEFDTVIAPYVPDEPSGGEVGTRTSGALRRIVVEVDGRRLEVGLPTELATPSSDAGDRTAPTRRKRASTVSADAAAGDSVLSPMQATVVKVVHCSGDVVALGDPVLQVEAMKMEQALRAPKDGVVEGLTVAVGEQVQRGQVICRIADGA